MKTKLILPPCPSYNIPAIEQWLSDMSDSGYFLSKDGFFLGFAWFEKGDPKRMIYRMEANTRKGILSADMDEPRGEVIDLAEASGWHFICRFRDFLIYASEESNETEFHSDPIVQSFALKHLKHSFFTNLFFFLLVTVFYGYLLSIGFLSLLLSKGFAFSITLILVYLIELASAFHQYWSIRKYYRILKNGESLRPSENYKKTGTLYRFFLTTEFMVFIVFLYTFLGVSLKAFDHPISLKNYSDPIPFATIQNYPRVESTFPDDFLSDGNTILKKRNLIAYEYIDYSEHSVVHSSIDGDYTVIYYVTYAYMKSEWLAKLLYRELKVDMKSIPLLHQKADILPLDTSALNCDEILLYKANLLMPTVILRKGNVVIKANLFTMKNDQKPVFTNEEWIQCLIDSVP